MADTQIIHENRCSIELSYSAMRHEYSWAIKSYHEPGGEKDALIRIEAVDLMLRDLYLPKPSDLERVLAASLTAAAGLPRKEGKV